MTPRRNTPPATVTGRLLDEARAADTAARAALEEAQDADPAAPGWTLAYEQASTAATGAARRLAALEAAYAAQAERAARRGTVAASSAARVAEMAAALTASRDQVGTAATVHLRTLAKLVTLAEAHNAMVSQYRAELSALGLTSDDDGPDGIVRHDDGAHPGPFGDGLRTGGTDWTPVPAEGMVAHSLRQVLVNAGWRSPFRDIGKYTWPDHQVGARPDGLAAPTLESANATAPAYRPPATIRRTPLDHERTAAA